MTTGAVATKPMCGYDMRQPLFSAIGDNRNIMRRSLRELRALLVLADEQQFALELEGEEDLAGLPDFVRSATRAAAQERGLPDKHLVTTSRSSVEPFLQFSSRRDLREKIFRAWIARGDGGGATDNKAIIAETLKLRAERARLLGYSTYADYRLDDAMAKSDEAVAARKECGCVFTVGK